MQKMAMVAVTVMTGLASSAAMAAAPPEYLEKVRCLAAFEAAAATLEPDTSDANARDRNTREPPAVAAMRQRIDDAGNRLSREVDAQNGLSDRDKDDADRAYQQESEKLFMLLDNAREPAEMQRAFQTLRERVDRCFDLTRS
jgi:hypothetical protein